MEFDAQWKHLVSKKSLHDRNRFKLSKERINEFLNDIKINEHFNSSKLIKNKICLDAGCGIGRWTWAILKLNPLRLDSFDISEEAVKLTKKINSKSFVFDIMDLKPNPVFDFVLSWNVIHHINDPRTAFSKLVSQVKKNGYLTIRVYNKDNDEIFSEGRKLFKNFSFDEKINYCIQKIKTEGGDIHGWFDALNPKYNYSFTQNDILEWFNEERFSDITFIPIKSRWKPNINVIARKN